MHDTRSLLRTEGYIGDASYTKLGKRLPPSYSLDFVCESLLRGLTARRRPGD